jgi:transposase
MKIFAALDVGDKATHICVLDDEGSVVWRGVCATDSEMVASTLERHAPGVERVVLETGITVTRPGLR